MTVVEYKVFMGVAGEGVFPYRFPLVSHVGQFGRIAGPSAFIHIVAVSPGINTH